MVFKFCKCGNIISFDKKAGFFTCSRCGFIAEKGKDSFLIIDKIKDKIKPIGVAKKGAEVKGIYFNCKKCANKEAEIMDAGIRYSDEDWIYLLRCTKCGYTEREGKMS